MHILKQSELDGMPCPNTLIHGECLESMKHIADGSIDMILCDLPYGTTACKWDSVIPFAPLWEAYKRVIKPGGAIVLTAAQPFTSVLVVSNLGLFKYELIYEKSRAVNPGLAKYQPMRCHESVLVFAKGRVMYNPQMEPGEKYTTRKEGGGRFGGREVTPRDIPLEVRSNRFPRSVLKIKSEQQNTIEHPTQKPVALFEYLIKTYTNPGELVLDNTMGSATLPVACLNTGRRFIGIELDDTYFAAGCARVRAREIELASTLPF